MSRLVGLTGVDLDSRNRLDLGRRGWSGLMGCDWIRVVSRRHEQIRLVGHEAGEIGREQSDGLDPGRGEPGCRIRADLVWVVGPDLMRS